MGINMGINMGIKYSSAVLAHQNFSLSPFETLTGTQPWVSGVVFAISVKFQNDREPL
jgi:hypothetical protein